MVAYKKTGSKMYKKKRLLKPKAKKAVVPKSIKAYVQQSISKNEEIKVQSFSAQTSLLSYTGTNLRTLDFNSVISLITQGTGEGQRIGNKVQIKDLTIKGWLSVGSTFYASVVATGPVIVKMFIGRLKQALTNPDVSTLYSRLYQAGNTSSSPQNNYFDVLRIINKDLFSVYNTRTYKLGVSGNMAASTVANNDFKVLCPFSFNMNKHYNNITFDDTVATPTNQAMYIWFVCVNADGTITNVGVPPLINCCYDMEVRYQDA